MRRGWVPVLLLLGACAKAPTNALQPPRQVQQRVEGSKLVVSWQSPTSGPRPLQYQVRLARKLSPGSTAVGTVEGSLLQAQVDTPPGEWVQAQVVSLTNEDESEPGVAEGWVDGWPYGVSAREHLDQVLFAALGAADFNRDGYPDLAVVGPSGGDVLVYLNKGDGSLAPVARQTLGVPSPSSTPRLLATGDVNGDGNPDLLVAGQVLLGLGDGTFAPGPNTLRIGPAPRWVAYGHDWALADLNGDGRSDVVETEGSSLRVYLSLADGGLGEPISSGTPSGSSSARSPQLAFADFNRDGHLDVALASLSGGYLGLGDGLGGCGLGWTPVDLTTLGSLAAADFTGDGCPDVLESDKLLRGHCDGGFEVERSGPASLVAVGDFDGDGALDALTNSLPLFGDGRGSFAKRSGWSASLGLGYGDPVVVADFNGDGRADLAHLESNGYTQDGDLVVTLSREGLR